MTESIHDDEPDISEPIVRSLLEAECPSWATAPLEYLATSGTDNAMWRVHLPTEPDVVVRLPRRPPAAAGVTQEVAVLRHLESARVRKLVQTPIVRHLGTPHDLFPHSWSVLEWIGGSDAWTDRHDLDRRLLSSLATDLGQAVDALGEITDIYVRPRSLGSRGGPLRPLLDRLDEWLTNPAWNATDLIDVAAVQRLAAEARELVDEPVAQSFVHGDLIPGNLLLKDGGLTAIIDWGGAGWGDRAQDFAPAWAVLTPAERPAFREIVGADDAAWLRGRTFELEHAVGGVLYYGPRRHQLGEVMARTLERILSEPN